MDATEAFGNLINQIQTANINYKIELSQFSATVHLKKSFIKDKNGNKLQSPVLVKPEIDAMRVKNENTIRSLQRDLENALFDSEQMYLEKENLKNKVASIRVKLADVQQENAEHGFKIKELESELKETALELHANKIELVKQHKMSHTKSAERESLGKKFKNLKQENQNLKIIAEERMKKIGYELAQALKDAKVKEDLIKAKNEKCEETLVLDANPKQVNTTIKRSNSPLSISSSSLSLSPTTSSNSSLPSSGLATTTPIPPFVTSDSAASELASSVPIDVSVSAPLNCTKVLNSSPPMILYTPATSTSSSPTAASIISHPSTASTTSTTASTTELTSYSHEPQCITRQPQPPPLSKYSFLHHPHSNYRQHMIDNTIPSRYDTHEYCMRIDHHNYGCEDCVWWKWYGELHGFPDIYPGNYRRYLD